LSFDEAMGSSWFSAVHKEDQVHCDRECRVKKKGKKLLEYRFDTRTGISWSGEQATLRENSEGKCWLCGCHIADITERKIAEGLIIKENSFLKRYISNLQGIFYLYNEDGKFSKWNKTQTGLGYEKSRN
jgi:hypothetical protein